MEEVNKNKSSPYYERRKGLDRESRLLRKNSILKNIVEVVLPHARDSAENKSAQVCTDINLAIDEAISQGLFIRKSKIGKLYVVPKGYLDWCNKKNSLIRDKKRLETARLIR